MVLLVVVVVIAITILAVVWTAPPQSKEPVHYIFINLLLVLC